MDRLDRLFAMQAELARFYEEARPDGFYGLPPIERCLTWTRALVHETCELEDELAWKPWKNGEGPDRTREARLAETADLLHFFVQLCLDQGFSSDELLAAYEAKWRINQERQRRDPRYVAPSARSLAD